MSSAVVAKRYAKALFEAAQEQGLLEQVEEELVTVDQMLGHTPELKKWLTHPTVDVKQKKEVLLKVSESMSTLTTNVLILLIERGREAVITDFVRSYQKLANEARGVAEAVVTTAVTLTEAEAAQLSQAFSKKMGKELRITNIVDPTIIGGVVVRIGDRLYDGSIKSKLDRFEQQLRQSHVS
ncbi:F0F1 ATP synthase subunit delta [Mechercharimyces sp. CAU 1602]|uniref:F0F1 ATP synthase subunit delta n=1 Tax=Mechercharimyces sp. CAU 1602 TaxID=2973933 RepID=UPI002161AC33|nr:F0F1 ATP synthase subunit delta [Mechercharimyces sp. CAU 1602]MCS1352283.1 F0F1 ATP synthase subunit delta [Mechercharimyces sp. CAU 1602]